MRITIKILIAIPFFLFVSLGNAQEQSEEREADRTQLLAILDQVEIALNSRDIQKLKAFVSKDTVVTFHDTKVVRGPEQLETYYMEKLGGANAILKNYSTQAEVDAPAIFYDNVAVAYGHSVDQYEFATGNTFDMTSRWTVTLRKVDGNWQILSLHFSANVFNNPLVAAVTNKLITLTVIAFGVGLLVMFALMKLLSKRGSEDQ